MGRAIEALITIITASTFYRWVRDKSEGKNMANPKGGQRKPREVRELVIEIAKSTGFGYTANRDCSSRTKNSPNIQSDAEVLRSMLGPAGGKAPQ